MCVCAMKDPRKSVNHLVQVYCKLFSTLCWNKHFHPCSSLWCSWQPFGLGRGDSCEFSAAPLDFGAVNMTDSDWPGINGKLPVFFFKCLLIDFPSRMYCLLLLWISLERCFQCGLPKSNLVLFNLRVGELGALWLLVLPLRNAGVHQVWLRWL